MFLQGLLIVILPLFLQDLLTEEQQTHFITCILLVRLLPTLQIIHLFNKNPESVLMVFITNKSEFVLNCFIKMSMNYCLFRFTWPLSYSSYKKESRKSIIWEGVKGLLGLLLIYTSHTWWIRCRWTWPSKVMQTPLRRENGDRIFWKLPKVKASRLFSSESLQKMQNNSMKVKCRQIQSGSTEYFFVKNVSGKYNRISTSVLQYNIPSLGKVSWIFISSFVSNVKEIHYGYSI